MNNSYILISAVRNEESFIENTIHSIISQTLLPMKWIIVSNNSVDRTEEIVKKYIKKYKFIELLIVKNNVKRNYKSKLDAFIMAYSTINHLNFEFLGNLDGDITLDPNYYEEIIFRFNKNAKLGIAGGILVENGGNTKNIITNLKSVGGGAQVFRRKCYDEIGGYLPLEIGGADAVAEIMARMKNWEVQAFPELRIYHHRLMGTGSWNIWQFRYFQGKEDYMLGYHPLFFFLKSITRIVNQPIFFGSILMLLGYAHAFILRMKRPVDREFIRFLREEQIGRLKKIFRREKSFSHH